MKRELVDIADLVIEDMKREHHEDAVMIIHFEDEGQDFTSWGVNSDGIVLSSKPYQTEVWKDTQVNLKELKLDVLPLIVTPNGDYTSLNYKVTRIEV